MSIKTTCIKLSALLLALVFVLSLTACGGSSSGSEATSAAQKTTTPATGADAQQSEKTADNKGVLVVFFSATGTTKGVAQQIAAAANADTYEILAAQPYSSDDLNWNDSNSRTTKEQNDKTVRPSIGSDKLSLDKYSTIFIGYPIWWGEEPRIMDTFVESYDFSGKTMVPFCTSGGSGIGSSGKNLEANAGSGKWLEGDRLSSSSDIAGWIDGLNL